jgi:transcriptional regulator with XRE-family HTH domain
MDLRLFGKRIREARERLEMTQEDLAEVLGKAQNAISSYENGTRAIRISELPDLAQALDVPIAYFFGDIEPDEEATALLAQLTPERRREILARLRLEVELQRQAEIERKQQDSE